MAEIAVDLLLGPDILSRTIAWFGQGPNGYSHAASVLSSNRYLDARNDAIAGVPAGVHIREIATETWIKKRRASLSVTDEEYATWEANLRAKITDGYGQGDILDFIDSNEKHAKGHYICSALAINAVQHVSRVHWKPGHLGYVPYPLPVPAHQVTPNACLLILATAGFTIGPVQVNARP